MDMVWNPWHGCHKISAGCRHCYMYRRDAAFGKDSTLVEKTEAFSLPLQRDRQGQYKLQGSGYVYACMSSDFFVEEADIWRRDAWAMIRERSDLSFFIVTKRIQRFFVSLPPDWGRGYENVTICCTCENQRMADERLPLLLDAPIRHRQIIHEPMLESIDIAPYLSTGQIEGVVCGGESGPGARPCSFDWVLFTRHQCLHYHVPFYSKQTGANFVKDGKQYAIPRRLQAAQAHKAGIDTAQLIKGELE